MPDIINSLKQSLCNLHGITQVQVIETHISWVLLTGKIAYKVKKPVNLGFVDFTTLEKRKFFCFEELRLNKRLAPELYIDVAAITRDADGTVINGNGPAVDYAVRLRQFDLNQQLDVLIGQHKLTLEHMQELAAVIANFHRTIPHTAPGTRYGDPDIIRHITNDNFHHCRPLLQEQQDRQDLDKLEAWSNREFSRLATALKNRKATGFIRECHGDLHLGNIAIFNDKITPFDCIEFNADFRWIDVISEVAFLVMDLFARERQDLAAHFLNDYLTLTGDYDGLNCLRFYLVYRAMVRAKVEIIRANQPVNGRSQPRFNLAPYHHFVKLANQLRHPGETLLVITHGLSGSGKTTIAKQLFQYWFAIHLRSDVERKRLFKLQATDKSDSILGRGIYTRDANEQTYTALYALAGHVLRNHWSVNVDATFLQLAQRNRFRQLAAELNARFVILDCYVEKKTLQQRIISRAAQATAISEATLQVLEHQIETAQSFAADEQPYVITVNTGQEIDIGKLARQLTHPHAEPVDAGP